MILLPFAIHINKCVLFGSSMWNLVCLTDFYGSMPSTNLFGIKEKYSSELEFLGRIGFTIKLWNLVCLTDLP